MTQDAVVVALFAVIGVGNTMLDVSTDTLLQRVVPVGSLPRALGVYESVLFVGKALGAVAAGGLAVVVDVGTALVAIGVLLPLAAILAVGRLRRLDVAMRSRDASVALLQFNAIFSPLVLSTVDRLARHARSTEHPSGSEIVTEGAGGDRVYVIEAGRAEVRRRGAFVAALEPGDCFGEMALLDDAPRNATVLATTDVVTRSLGRDDFLDVVETDEAARLAASRLVEERRPD